MERIVNLSKRRGFIFPSAEIYGGFRSTYDYGPLGVLMLRNVKDAWWRSMVQLRDDVVGIDAAILSTPKIWEASGHLDNFTDPLVDCRNCHERWRADKIDGTCPNCGSTDLTEPRAFNLMFKTFAGPVEEDATVAYLRPETAQGMFVNFLNVLTTTRKKPPFGIAQVGKSFRNEITPQNFVFRTREFEQMEMEYFVPPDEADQWFHYWLDERMRWYLDLGIPAVEAAAAPPRRRRALALLGGHRRRGVPLPLGLGRARGHRQPHRLRPEGPRRALGRAARVLRPGHRRALRALRHRARRRRHPHHDGLPPRRLRRGRGRRRASQPCCTSTPGWRRTRWRCCRCRRRTSSCRWRARCWGSLQPVAVCDFDTTQSIGRRYRRQDEVGTPYCVTVDFDSLEDGAVTVRDRDTTEQVRVPIDRIAEEIAGRLRR